MNTTTQSSPANEKLRLQLNMQTMQVHMELKSLLLSFGASTSLAQLAASTFGSELHIEEAPDAESHLYYLPLRLIPDFIDQILDQLDPDSRVAAIEYRDINRTATNRTDQYIKQALATNPNLLGALQLRKKNSLIAHALHELVVAHQKRSPDGTRTRSVTSEY